MQGLLQSVERVPEPPPGTCSPFPWLHPLNIGSARRPPRRGSVIVRYQAASLNCYRAKDIVRCACSISPLRALDHPGTATEEALHSAPMGSSPYREEEKPLDAYAVSWKDLRRRRGSTVASFVGAVLSFLGATSAPSMVGALCLCLTCLLVGVGTMSCFWMWSFKCPRCKNGFYVYSTYWMSASGKKCPHCGLVVGDSSLSALRL